MTEKFDRDKHTAALATALIASKMPLPPGKIAVVEAPVTSLFHFTGKVLHSQVAAIGVNKTQVQNAVELVHLLSYLPGCTNVIITPTEHELGPVLESLNDRTGARLRLHDDGRVEVLECCLLKDDDAERAELGAWWTERVAELLDDPEGT